MSVHSLISYLSVTTITGQRNILKYLSDDARTRNKSSNKKVGTQSNGLDFVYPL